MLRVYSTQHNPSTANTVTYRSDWNLRLQVVNDEFADGVETKLLDANLDIGFDDVALYLKEFFATKDIWIGVIMFLLCTLNLAASAEYWLLKIP